MKRFVICLIYLNSFYYLAAQKPLIDSVVYKEWTTVSRGQVSNDGKYVLCVKGRTGDDSLIIQAVDKKWKTGIHIKTDNDPIITQDSKRVFFMNENDSLGNLELGTSSIKFIPYVNSFKLSKIGNGGWIAYHLEKPQNRLILQNLTTGFQNHFDSVENYFFCDDGNMLLLQKLRTKDNEVIQSLDFMNFQSGYIFNIWQGSEVGGFVFDNSNTQFAFISKGKVGNQVINSLWYYKVGTEKAVSFAVDSALGDANGLNINDIKGFSKDDSLIFFTLREGSYRRKGYNSIAKIWSYNDTRLKPFEYINYKNYSAVIHINDHKIVRLEQDNDNIMLFPFDEKSNNGELLVFHTDGDASLTERNWNAASKMSILLVSARDGTRRKVNKIGENWAYISPQGKYLIYYDRKTKNYFSYTISTGITRNITKVISTAWTVYGDPSPEAAYHSYAPGGWLANDSAVFLYDQNDVWQIDPLAIRLPINLTNRYGKSHGIVFRLITFYSGEIITDKRKFILIAFNRRTKDNGFYSKEVGKSGNPQLLTMGQYVYYLPDPPPDINGGVVPIKAKEAETYLVKRMSATESPNYYITKDFKNFTEFSNLHPENYYNWLTTQLVEWKTFDGSISQGVLYKPENFNPRKKYPIIFYYYRVLSDGLNEYLEPRPSDGRLKINIPYFVSNGYLVFTPDIHYKIGETGNSVLNSVVSAAKFLSKMPFVNARKMGIQGHSFGGYETNYLVTHTGLFAAACSSSGLSDFVSGYGSISNYESKQTQFEVGPYQIGATLWQRPELYIENSPIFRANKVTTPLLLMGTPKDVTIPFAQAVELFTALRRLGKKSWLLQYDDGNHIVAGKSAIDFNIRLTQFFDYYLKDAPPPKWMTGNSFMNLNGTDTEFELDLSGKKP